MDQACELMNHFCGEEVVFTLPGITLRGERWGDPDGLPVIALHGWLDNAGSFDFLAPELKSVNLVALDLAGHGKSDHRPLVAAYNIWLDVAEVLGVAEQLDWATFGLLGHSRGAMISTILAGAFPEKVSHLALIEAIVPQPIPPEEAPAQLASSINITRTLARKPQREHANHESAVVARTHGMTELALDDARALARRGVEKRGNGYCWTNDYKVMAPSEVKFTREQVEAFISCLSLEVLIFAGKQGIINSFHQLDEWLEKYPYLRRIELEGDHHLHMSTNHKAVATYCNTYFKTQPKDLLKQTAGRQ